MHTNIDRSSLSFPKVSGFSFRLMENAADIGAMLAVHASCRERDQIDPYSVCYKLVNRPASEYAERVEQSPAGTVLLATAGGPADQVVAHGWMDVWGFEERLYLWHVWVMPEYRKRGLGTEMLRWGEVRARELHGDDSRPALHLANATEGEADAVRLLYKKGYHLSFVSPELAFDATSQLADDVVVPGITIRPLDDRAHLAVARAICEANLNSPGQEKRLTGDALEQRIDVEEEEWLGRVRDCDPAMSPIAWDGDAVAGAYLCRRSGEVGEISQVAVRADWRGRGIARALAMRSLRSLLDAGCTTARLYTSIGPDEDEPTEGPYAMYRKFGFAPIARHLRFRKPMIP